MKLVYTSVNEGIEDTIKYIHEHPYEFINLGHRATFINCKIVAKFKESYSNKSYLINRINHIYSNKSIYFLIDEKYLLCFKAIDAKKYISNSKSKRHLTIMKSGEAVFSKKIMEELVKRGIHFKIPLYFAGFNGNEKGLFSTFIIRYFNEKIDFEMNLSELFASDSLGYKVHLRGGEMNEGLLINSVNE